MNQEWVFLRTSHILPIIYCHPGTKRKKCVLFANCPTCLSWPERSCHIVFVCRVCHQLCCDRCAGKGLRVLYCPHCGRRAALEPLGHSCYYPFFLREGLPLDLRLFGPHLM
jgi:hypothetical protein